MRIRVVAFVALTVLLLAPVAAADTDRRELARRLQAFEAEWMQQTDDAVRKRAVPALRVATRSFFLQQLAVAAEELDRARRVLTPAGESDAVIWAGSLRVRPAVALIDAGRDALHVSISRAYGNATEVLDGARVRLRLVKDSDSGQWQAARLSRLPANVILQLADAPAAGDCQLEVAIHQHDTWLATHRMRVSRVPRLAERLDGLAGANAIPADSSAGQTVAARADLLRQLQRGEPYEVDVAADRLLRDTEALVARVAAGGEWLSAATPGDHRVALATGDRVTHARLFVPEGLGQPERVPLVIAQHGVGGSENMFFDSLGAGLIVTLCRERGWLLVAPRLAVGESPAVSSLVDELARWLPVDTARVFVVGHSMGAMAGVSQVQAEPDRIKALVALGGGSLATSRAAFRDRPVFIGAGSEDFAILTVRSLQLSARMLGADLTVREYDGIDHLMVVATALPDAFKWLDNVAK